MEIEDGLCPSDGLVLELLDTEQYNSRDILRPSAAFYPREFPYLEISPLLNIVSKLL